MQRAVCERCGHFQPADWSAGDLCVACGAAVRSEVRCAWCAVWVPAAAYCRSCGCEVASPEEYAAARMLKSAGVDRFSLLERLRSLDRDQALNLTRIYNAQLAVVSRRVEELRFCESYLLQKGFFRQLEEELLPELPLEKDRLAALAAEPEGRAEDGIRRLAEIAGLSPIPFTRTLAGVALLRTGDFNGASALAAEALFSKDFDVALEAALAFAHWRVRSRLCDRWSSGPGFAWGAGGRLIDRWRVAEVAEAVPWGSPLRPWAAAASALSWFGETGMPSDPNEPVRRRPAGSPPDAVPPGWLRTELAAGLSSRDPDLRFTCALSLGEESVIARMLDSGDEQRELEARRCLVARNSPALASYLLRAPEETCGEILDGLWSPLPKELVDPVLQIACRCPGRLRRSCVSLLSHSLNEGIVARLVRVGCAERDVELFELLLGADDLPGAREVLRAILRTGLLGALVGSLRNAAKYVDFSDGELMRLVERGGPEVVEGMVDVAGAELQKVHWSECAQPEVVGRFLASVAFGEFPSGIRERAFSELQGSGLWDGLKADGIRGLFGSGKQFASATLRSLRQSEPEEIVRLVLEQLSERWSEVAEPFTEDRHAFIQLVDSAAKAARDDSRSAHCHEEASRLLTTLAVARPKLALPAVSALLRECGLKYEYRQIPKWLLAGYESLERQLKASPRLAADLADALAQDASSTDDTAAELLRRLARDHPTLRERILARLDPRPDDLSTAEDSGIPSGQAASDESERYAAQDLDHAILMPSSPLKTLAEYVAFLKAMERSEDPLSVMSSHGMTQKSFSSCISGWGEELAKDNRLAMRYVELMQREPE